MTKEDQSLDENVEESTTPNEESESEDTSLEDLFDDESEKEESDADKVKRLEEKLANIEKGVKKLATDKGREAKEKKEPKEKPKETPSINDEVIEELLLTKHPEAEHVLDELKDTAKQTGKSVLTLYRESKYFKGEAKALADAKKSEEESKSRIGSPSNGGGNKVSIPHKDIDLKNPEHVKWLNAKQERRDEYAKWLKNNLV